MFIFQGVYPAFFTNIAGWEIHHEWVDGSDIHTPCSPALWGSLATLERVEGKNVSLEGEVNFCATSCEMVRCEKRKLWSFYLQLISSSSIFAFLDPKNQCKNGCLEKIRILKRRLCLRNTCLAFVRSTQAEKTYIRNLKIIRLLSLRL